MTRTAVVVGSDGKGYARIRVKRESACSHACGSCGGCRAEIMARARDPLGAKAGDRVLISSSTGKVMRAAAVVYGLPAVLMTLAAVLAACLGQRDTVCALYALAALSVGCGISVLFGRIKKNVPEYTITKIEQ